MAIADPRVVQLDKWYEQLRSQRSPYEALWRDIITYVRPLRTSPLVVISPGQSQMQQVFASTAIQANSDLGAMLHGSMTSSAFRWFALRMRIDELNEDQETQVWLDACADRCFRALVSSNFGSEGIETYLDLGAFGVAATILTESPQKIPGVRFAGLDFKTIGIGEYVLAEGTDGSVDTFARCLVKSAVTVKRQWPAAVANSDELRMKVQQNPFDPIEIIHAVFPRDMYPEAAVDPKPYVSMYWLQRDKVLLSESGYWEFPVLAPRWAKSGQEVYGRGPGHTALYDVMTLNRAKELGLKAWDKAIDPPLKALAEGVVGSVRMTPGGISYVQTMDALQPLMTGAMANLNWTQLELAEMRSSIRETFYSSSLELPNQPYMTAEEIVRRYELMERKLGPTLGRLESEYLAPLIRRVFLLLLRAGMLPTVPPAVQDAMKSGLSEIDIRYEGPLARSQRNVELQSITKTIAFVDPIAKVKPEVLDNFLFDDIARKGALDAGLKPSLLASPASVNKLRQDRAKLRAMQAQAAQKVAQAQAAASVGQAAQSMSQANLNNSQLPGAQGAPPPNAGPTATG